MLAELLASLPRIVRFLIIGAVNTGVSYTVYAVGLYLGLSYAVANLVSLLVGICFSFTTQRAWVFQDASRPRFWRFVLVWGIIYLVNIAVIKGFVDLGVNAYWAGALALPFIVVLSYAVQRFIVFAPSRT